MPCSPPSCLLFVRLPTFSPLRYRIAKVPSDPIILPVEVGSCLVSCGVFMYRLLVRLDKRGCRIPAPCVLIQLQKAKPAHPSPLTIVWTRPEEAGLTALQSASRCGAATTVSLVHYRPETRFGGRNLGATKIKFRPRISIGSIEHYVRACPPLGIYIQMTVRTLS